MSLSPATPFFMNPARKPSRNRTAHDWLDYLRESDGLGGILAKTEDLAKLKARLFIALETLDLGHLSSKIEAGWRSGGQDELFLLVSSASIGTRLQQILPSLINELAMNGLHCKVIKVKVKPSAPAWEVKPRENTKNIAPKGLNPVAKKSWQDLLEKLEPDSDLHKAVERLLQNKSH
ncbi:hypothetical protein [Polynucleobacter sp. MWH-Creno-3A4]|uniref:hypothetical protein n=1 Tax=Polynucleobacter sp. MWH-Creno-3A4 TaxID=1855886 RepID=UPI0021036239|nr:hypothetical protein [Polynucleobacter sp. MWH-Creno-3A4]